MPLVGMTAETDLSDNQFYAAKFSGTTKDYQAILSDATGTFAGIILNKAKAGEPVTISHVSDVFAKAKLGADVVAGQLLMVDTDGTLIPQTGVKQAVAISPVKASDGDIITVFLHSSIAGA